MKKRNLHSLQLKKSTISNLNVHALTGGSRETHEDACKDKTATTCSQFAKCDSKQICTANICKPVNIDDQLPIG